MCPKTETPQYIENQGRYDAKTNNMLRTFLKHGRISAYFEFDPVGNKNITRKTSAILEQNE